MDTIDRINLLLAKKGKTGADLNKAIGVSNAVYSQWNTRKSKPSKKSIAKVAEYLDTTVEYLLGDFPEQKSEKEKPTTKIGDGFTKKEIELIQKLRAAKKEDQDPQKSFTIKSYINIIEVLMRFYRILFFLQESKNTILIIKVCYFFAQKIARLP